MHIRERRRSIEIKQQTGDSPEKDTSKKFVSFGRIKRNYFPKLRVWYVIIFIFVGILGLIYKLFFAGQKVVP